MASRVRDSFRLTGWLITMVSGDKTSAAVQLPLVSVVIPAFNQAEYLREAIASALAQTHERLEVVVVDDGSTDTTQQVCASFHDDRVRYVRQENDRTYGIGARNHAILLAQGDWIALLDQDDRWAPEKLARQLRRLGADDAIGLVFCRAQFIDGAGQLTGQQDGPLPEGDVFHALLSKNTYYAASGMFRRDLLRVCGLPHAMVGLGDHALWLTLSRWTRVAVVDEVLVDYRIHPQGYQEVQRRAALDRLAQDGRRFVDFQKSLLHEDCAVCRRANLLSRRDVAKRYVAAVRSHCGSGQFGRAWSAAINAVRAAPRWTLAPWNLLQQGFRVLWAMLLGLVRPL